MAEVRIQVDVLDGAEYLAGLQRTVRGVGGRRGKEVERIVKRALDGAERALKSREKRND